MVTILTKAAAQRVQDVVDADEQIRSSERMRLVYYDVRCDHNVMCPGDCGCVRLSSANGFS